MSPATYAEVIEHARQNGGDMVLVERDGAHAVVTMNDPRHLNALSAALTVQLRLTLSELALDTSLRAIVLTGTDPAFSAGGDLRLMRDAARPMLEESDGGGTEIWRWIRNEFGAIAKLITRTDKAFIAAVNGPAAGVGLAFALACDMLIASEQARIVPAFAGVGLIPEVGTSWQLTRRLGYQKTFELFAAGRHLSGAEAAELGIVNAVVPHDELLPEAMARVEQIEAAPEHVIAMMKPLLRNAADMTWEQAIAMEEFAEPSCFTTRAHRDAVTRLLKDAT
ncbi:MAG TPA: enoyl-CoA hydratase/isomerase family protein [Burkholderiaceae bacterium]|nr:enoyl-CoA hydratase/isomerase family protein [Burkholderiaceae bacterium]